MPSLTEDARTAVLIARVELRRDLRSLTAKRERILALALVGLMVTPFVTGACLVAYDAGVAVRTGSLQDLTVLRGLFTSVVVALLAVMVVGTATQGSVPDGADLLLTTSDTRSVVAGAVLSRVVGLAVWTLPGLPVLTAFVVGARAPHLLVVGPLVLGPVVATVAIVGYALGLFVALAGRYLPIPSWVKGLAWTAFVGGLIVGGQFAGRAYANGALSLDPVASLLGSVPVGAYAELLVVGTPASDRVDPAAIALGLSMPVVAVAALRATTAVATRLWFGDDRSDEAPEHGRTSVPRPFVWSDSGVVGWHYLVRTRRRPRQLAHLNVVVFATFPLVTTFDSVDQALAFGPALGVGLGALLAGATFCCNPLGDEGDALAYLLTCGAPADRFLRGRIVAGLAVGYVSLALGVTAGVVSGAVDAVSAGLTGLFGVALCPAAACWALGLGSLFPNFGTEEVFGVETTRPSNFALLPFLFGSAGIAGGGLFLVGVPTTSAPHLLSHAGLLLGYALAVGLLAFGGYWYARRRYRRQTI